MSVWVRVDWFFCWCNPFPASQGAPTKYQHTQPSETKMWFNVLSPSKINMNSPNPSNKIQLMVTGTPIIHFPNRHRASFRRSSGGAFSRRSTGVCSSSADKMGVSSDPPLRLLRGATRWAGSPSWTDQQGRTKLSPF